MKVVSSIEEIRFFIREKRSEAIKNDQELWLVYDFIKSGTLQSSPFTSNPIR